jgi:monoamine oxidase
MMFVLFCLYWNIILSNCFVLHFRAVRFEPALPSWKSDSIHRLGFGLLNKIALHFPDVFWDDSLDYFGQTTDSTPLRGEFYLFWNLHRCMGKPVLIALIAGQAAFHSETLPESEILQRVMRVLMQVLHTTYPLCDMWHFALCL